MDKKFLIKKISDKNIDNEILNIGFEMIDSESLLMILELEGIAVSFGYACTSGVAEKSHVLKAIGLSDTDALNSVRITIGHQNTEEEIDMATDIITQLVERIRENEE